MPPRPPSREEPVSALRSIPIHECGEPLVEIVPPGSRLYWTPRHPVFAYHRFRLIRETVARELVAAAEFLPPGLRLAVVEGWRHPVIQRRMHEQTRERLRREHPDWPPARLSRTANRFSAPLSRRVPPPHVTGGAIDVHLVDEHGEPLDFVSPYSLVDAAAAAADAPGLSTEAAANRALLREVMQRAGLTNYPAEWWHWSYGDQAWAYRGGHPAALYGAVIPPAAEGVDLSFAVHDSPGL